jgi:NTP pyrophosphatase (non-canonical NTP hydrolase)
MKTLNEYQALAMRTAKQESFIQGMVHVALGLTGEAGEFSDAIKKFYVYNKPLDYENAVEELGDLLWYVALGCETLGMTMSQVAERNISKLQKRYPEKYTDELAAQRLDKEKE